MEEINYFEEAAKEKPLCFSLIGGTKSLRENIAKKLSEEENFRIIKVSSPLESFVNEILGDDVSAEEKEEYLLGISKKIRQFDKDFLMRRFFRIFREDARFGIIPDLTDKYDLKLGDFITNNIYITEDEEEIKNNRNIYKHFILNGDLEVVYRQVIKILKSYCAFNGHCFKNI